MSLKRISRFIVIIWLCCSVVACKTESQNNVLEVSGIITNAAGRKISLMQVDLNNFERIITDTLFTIKQDNRFFVTASYEKDGLYQLYIDSSFYILLIADSGRIKVNADYKNKDGYEVSGSKASLALLDYYKEVKKYSLEKRTLNEQRKAVSLLSKREITDSARQVQLSAIDTLMKRKETALYHLVSNESNATAAYFKYGIAKSIFPASYLNDLVKTLHTKFPKQPKLQALYSSLDTSKHYLDSTQIVDTARAILNNKLLNQE